MVKNAAILSIGLLLVLLTFIGVANADIQTPPPTVSEDLGKIKVGARPSGKIAFISDGNVWIMDTDGRNRQLVTNVGNAKGRLSFSPDNKIIAFSREGKDMNNLPSGEGGSHLLHDIFLAYIDSAATRSNWWKRLTSSLGAYRPDWSYDGSVIYYQNDVNAGFVDYIVPSHQMAKIEVEGANSSYLRKDWQTTVISTLMPTVSADGKKIAFVLRYSKDPTKYNFKKHGIKIVDMANIALPVEKLKKPSPGLENGYAPSWSPDGQWLAYVVNDIRNPGIYIIKADLSENRLVFAPTVTQQPNAHPVGWSPDSRWLVFAATDGIIYTIDINGDNLAPLTGPGKHNNPTWSK